LPDQAKDVGYKSGNFITNMKILSFLVLVYIGKLLAFFLIKFWIFATKNRYGTKKYLKTFSKNLFFNEIIALCIGSLLEFFIGVYVTIKAPIFTKFGESLSQIIAYFMLVCIFIVLPLFIIISACLNKEKLIKKSC
jgi:hypothetical protein